MDSDLRSQVRDLLSDAPDQGFPSSQVAERFQRDESEIAQVLGALRDAGLAHQDQGNWYPGPEPPAPSVDQS